MTVYQIKGIVFCNFVRVINETYMQNKHTTHKNKILNLHLTLIKLVDYFNH